MLLITGLFRFFGILHDMLTWWILLVNGCTMFIKKLAFDGFYPLSTTSSALKKSIFVVFKKP